MAGPHATSEDRSGTRVHLSLIGKLGLAPTACRGRTKLVLEVTDASGDPGCFDQTRGPVIIIGGHVGAHECVLVGRIFEVKIHVSSPAWAGMPMHGRE